MNEIMKKIDKKAGGNVGILNVIYKNAIMKIKKTCKTKEEYRKQCQQFLDTVCAQMGEENREFYMNYMRQMDPDAFQPEETAASAE